MNRKFWLGLIVGASAMRLVYWYVDALERRRQYDYTMSRIWDSVPESQRADFRSDEEKRKNPHPTSWKM